MAGRTSDSHLRHEIAHADFDGTTLAEHQLCRYRPRHSARYSRSFCRGLVDRHAGFEPRQHRHDADLPCRGRRQHIRRPQLNVAIGKVEPCRRHADDLVLLAVELHGAADRGWIPAEAPLPQSVAEDDDAVRALRRLLFTEEAARLRRHSKQREHRRREARALDS